MKEEKHEKPDKPDKQDKTEPILEFVHSNAITILILLSFSILLSFPERHWVDAGFGLLCMYVWVYFVHRLLHAIPEDSVFQYLNTHVLFHHHKHVERTTDLSIETLNNLAMSFSVLYIQWLTGVWVVPTSVILLYAFVYTSTHIINYSMFGSQTHRNHHKDMTTNYGPDTLDHVFGSNYDSTFEDLTPISLNAIGSFVVVYGLKQYFQWKN